MYSKVYSSRNSYVDVGDTEGGRGQNRDEVHGADAVFVVGFGRKY